MLRAILWTLFYFLHLFSFFPITWSNNFQNLSSKLIEVLFFLLLIIKLKLFHLIFNLIPYRTKPIIPFPIHKHLQFVPYPPKSLTIPLQFPLKLSNNPHNPLLNSLDLVPNFPHSILIFHNTITHFLNFSNPDCRNCAIMFMGLFALWTDVGIVQVTGWAYAEFIWGCMGAILYWIHLDVDYIINFL